MSLLLLLVLACGSAEPEATTPTAPPPVEAQAPEPSDLALSAWEAVTGAIGTDQLPRVLMDQVDPEVLGVYSPLVVAEVLDRFVRDWGRDALGTSAAVIRSEGDLVHMAWTGKDPIGRPVAVHAVAREGKLLVIGVDEEPGRMPPVLGALEVSTTRMAAGTPAPAPVDPRTGQELVLPGGIGEDGQAQVLVEDVKAQAPLSRDDAWLSLGPVLEAAHGCYLRRLEAGARVTGQLRFRVALAASGKVSQVSRQGDALDLDLDTCTRRALERLRYGKQAGDTAFEVSLHFVLPLEALDVDGGSPVPPE